MRKTAQLFTIFSVLLSLVIAGSAPLEAVERTFAISGTVSSSPFTGIPNGAAFSGTYTVDDAATDTDASGQLGVYSTGALFVFIDGVGTATLDQSGSTLIQNDVPQGFPGFNVDALEISALEGSRSLPFTNAIQNGRVSFSVGLLGTPTALTSDSLPDALTVDLASWGGSGTLGLNISDTGDASCTDGLVTICNVQFEITSLEPAFALTVTKDGTGTGTVTSSPPGIECGATCTAALGGTVTLTATPDAGSVFAGWTGCDSTSGDQCTVDVNADRTVNATFDVEAHTLTVTKDGTGTGTVTSAPAGIDCGATCAADFAGTVVLTATPDAGSVFGGWTGCDSTTGDQCTVDVNAARTVNATFAIDTYTVTVTKTGPGDGTVTSTPAGIDCGATCAAQFAGMVTLAAAPAAGSVFAGWTGCDSVTGETCAIFVEGADVDVEAAFETEASVLEIPTVSEWGLILLASLLSLLGIWSLAGRFA